MAGLNFSQELYVLIMIIKRITALRVYKGVYIRNYE